VGIDGCQDDAVGAGRDGVGGVGQCGCLRQAGDVGTCVAARRGGAEGRVQNVFKGRFTNI
jgi:hypothetical protein